MTQRTRPVLRWASRVEPARIQRLYTTDARGIFDDELVDDVGYAIYARCKSIERATQAHKHGRAACPGCGEYIAHNWDRTFMLACARCDWQMTWGAYRNTIQGQRLYGGGAVEAFEGFIRDWERADAYPAKMRAIDALLHAFHYDLKNRPCSIAARNVIEGNTGQVLAFLERLAYGDGGTPEIQKAHGAYRATLETTGMRLPEARLTPDDLALDEPARDA